MSINPLVRLGQLGQAPWYDFITRDLLVSGALRRMVEVDGLAGLTSNPTIFQKAIAESTLYDDQIRRLARRSESREEIFEAIAVTDVRDACDIFLPRYESSGGRDGLVSIEVPPGLAYDTAATISEARRLWGAVQRPNVMIKVPGTTAGLPAVRSLLAEGINVNVTLLFAVARYEDVIGEFFAGLEERAARGLPIDRIASVASFFVSRVDTKVDARLAELGDPEGLRGRVGIANAATAYVAFHRAFATERWKRLAQRGAAPQRPLWASTSTKDRRYSDLHYVEALVAPRTVNTMPPQTFEAYRDHGWPEVRIHEAIATAPACLTALQRLEIDLRRITDELEEEGVRKFAASYDSLLAGIETRMLELSPEAGAHR